MRQMPGDHTDRLHTVSLARLEYETLTGEEIKKLIAGEALDRSDPIGPPSTQVVDDKAIPEAYAQGPVLQRAPQGARASLALIGPAVLR